jgi:hypothetical protein
MLTKFKTEVSALALLGKNRLHRGEYYSCHLTPRQPNLFQRRGRIRTRNVPVRPTPRLILTPIRQWIDRAVATTKISCRLGFRFRRSALIQP